MSIAPIRPLKISKKDFALKRQSRIGFSRQGQSFTLNPVWGDGKLLCPFKCRYCYTQKYYPENDTAKRKPSGSIFFKPELPELLDRELSNYAKEGFPQHLKTVQINESFEYYIPEIMDKTMIDGKDLLYQIFEVFKKHWDAGNKWMLHILTKSPHILKHTDLLSQMRDMVQIEMTIICLDDDKRKLVAPLAPSVPSRLDAIRKLSDAGIFVRVMAMPLFGDKNKEDNIAEAKELWETTQQHGARAFKHKNLNYATWDEVIRGKALDPNKYNKHDSIYEPLLVKSGNIWRDPEGNGRLILVKIPGKGWEKTDWQTKLDLKHVPVIDYGYSEMNDVYWEYIHSSGSNNILNEPTLVNHIKKQFVLKHSMGQV